MPKRKSLFCMVGRDKVLPSRVAVVFIFSKSREARGACGRQ